MITEQVCDKLNPPLGGSRVSCVSHIIPSVVIHSVLYLTLKLHGQLLFPVIFILGVSKMENVGSAGKA